VEAITQIWNYFLVWPIEAGLTALANVLGSAGLAIIVFTIAVRTVMLPLGIRQARSQKAMSSLQPQLREIQKRYPGDRAKQSQEQMRLYRESGVNPAMGCLPLVIQMPIWFALYSSLINLSHNVEAFSASFLWIPSLAHADPYYILPVLTGVTQWVVQRMSTLPSADPQQQQMNRMLEFMPVMFFVFSLQVASGLALYWVVSNVYSFAQQYFIVGWGNLPYLGTRNRPPADPNGNGNGAAKELPGRRARNGSPAPRRRKGK
jgi:YidC/Oxa1 family membrane protein insertase